MIQVELFPRDVPGHGGRRAGARRKPGPRARVPHARRAQFSKGVLHVTSRVVPVLRSLRCRKLVRIIEGCLREGCERAGFRITNDSIQRDHIHYVVEAADRNALAEGMRGVHVRIAHAVNRVLDRFGRVFAQRYHARRLRTPREVRNAIRYVLNNARKHGLLRRGDSARSITRRPDAGSSPGSCADGRGPDRAVRILPPWPDPASGCSAPAGCATGTSRPATFPVGRLGERSDAAPALPRTTWRWPETGLLGSWRAGSIPIARKSLCFIRINAFSSSAIASRTHV